MLIKLKILKWYFEDMGKLEVSDYYRRPFEKCIEV